MSRFARPVYIAAAGSLHAGGEGVEVLLDAPDTLPAPRARDFAATIGAFEVDAPPLPNGVFDRRLARNLEPQGQRLLVCAGRLAPALAALGVADHRCGIAAALPEVDQPSPCWEAVEAIRAGADPVTALLHHTPPLHGLMMLGSSTMAHLAEGLGCRGPMAGFASQDGAAGVDALIEACQLVADGAADCMLACAVSPGLQPGRYLRGDGDASQPALQGEGSAAMLLTATPPGTGEHASIVGFARAHTGAQPEQVAEQMTALVSGVLASAVDDDDEIVLAMLAGHKGAPALPAGIARIAPSARLIGELGPAGPLLDLALLVAAAARLPRQHPCHGRRLLLRIAVEAGGHASALLLAIGHEAPR
jgi:hypothetical protein